MRKFTLSIGLFLLGKGFFSQLPGFSPSPYSIFLYQNFVESLAANSGPRPPADMTLRQAQQGWIRYIGAMITDANNRWDVEGKAFQPQECPESPETYAEGPAQLAVHPSGKLWLQIKGKAGWLDPEGRPLEEAPSAPGAFLYWGAEGGSLIAHDVECLWEIFLSGEKPSGAHTALYAEEVMEQVWLVDLSRKKRLHLHEIPDYPAFIVHSPDGRYCWTETKEGIGSVYALASGLPLVKAPQLDVADDYQYLPWDDALSRPFEGDFEMYQEQFWDYLDREERDAGPYAFHFDGQKLCVFRECALFLPDGRKILFEEVPLCVAFSMDGDALYAYYGSGRFQRVSWEEEVRSEVFGQ